MRISLAIISALLAPAALAGSFIPIQQQQQQQQSNILKPNRIAGITSYLKNAMKMSGFQRRQIEKDIDTFEGPVRHAESSASDSISYAVYQQGSNYIYQPVAVESMKTYVISDSPQPSFVYALIPPSSAPAQIIPRPSDENIDLLTKVQISNDDIYFSQTDSFTIPDLSSFPADSPYIREWPEIPDEAPPRIGLPNESSDIA
ncbi:hypothetical protein BD408DRAFT_427386 [Parasitella parasitica]|nr:hypothetical protein BD408DRAFT_427386 [Parasitella parasitica]